jgi:hypothetical protein
VSEITPTATDFFCSLLRELRVLLNQKVTRDAYTVKVLFYSRILWTGPDWACWQKAPYVQEDLLSSVSVSSQYNTLYYDILEDATFFRNMRINLTCTLAHFLWLSTTPIFTLLSSHFKLQRAIFFLYTSFFTRIFFINPKGTTKSDQIISWYPISSSKSDSTDWCEFL